MSPFAIASIVFGCSFGAALIGMVHVKLPDHHLDGDSRDVVKLVMNLIATMAALVLSLLIASANSSYDRQSSELKTLSTNILLLDRTLKFYAGAKEARDGLRDAIVQTHNRIWSREGVRPENLDSRATQNSVNASIERALVTGNNSTGSNPNAVYFTAGLVGEMHGLFGDLAVVPEPGSLALLATGLGGLMWSRRRRGRKPNGATST